MAEIVLVVWVLPMYCSFCCCSCKLPLFPLPILAASIRSVQCALCRLVQAKVTTTISSSHSFPPTPLRPLFINAMHCCCINCPPLYRRLSLLLCDFSRRERKLTLGQRHPDTNYDVRSSHFSMQHVESILCVPLCERPALRRCPSA